jgi:beta-lactamase class A
MWPLARRARLAALVVSFVMCSALLLATPGLADDDLPPPAPDADGWSYAPPALALPRLDGLPAVLGDLIGDSEARWGIAVRDLATGETIGLNLTQRFAAASLYKVGVLLEVQHQLEEGRLRAGRMVAVSARDVDREWGGSAFAAGTFLSIEDALESMITRSDNGSAMALVRSVGGGNVVNARFRSLGMPQTVYDDTPRTSPADQLTLFTALAAGEAVSPEASAAALRLLARQQVRDRIPQGLPANGDWFIAHKTGDYYDVIADSGIVVTPRSAYVLSLIANDPTSTRTRALFGSISAAVYEVFASETSYAEFPSDLYLLFAEAALADEAQR